MTLSDQEKSAPVTPQQDGVPEPAGAALSPTVIALGVVSLCTDVSSEMVYTQMPLFITQVLGQPPWVVGLIEGLAESTASLMKVVSGRLSDISGRRKPLTLMGYSLGAISKPLIGMATLWPFVLFARFLDRLGKGLRTAPRDALIAESTAPKMRGRAFGLHRTMDTTGAVIGPALAFCFLKYVSPDIRNLFFFAGLPGLIAVLVLAFTVKERPKPASAEGSPVPKLPRWRDLQPSYRQFLIAVFIFNLGNSSDAFLILRASSIGVSASNILLLYSAFNLVEAFLGYAAGRLSDRVGRRPLILAGYALFALVYVGFALAHTQIAVWLLFLLYGGYYTLTQGVQRAFAADLADPQQRATQIGAYHTIVGVALLPASLIAGQLFAWNPAAPFYYGAALALVSAVLLALNTRTVQQGR